MKNFEDMEYFIPQEKLVKTLVQKTQNNNPLFFRILTVYYFSKIASMMRVNVKTMHQGTIPVNTYAINLSVSGSGKGFSTNIIEESVIHLFKERFLNETFPALALHTIHKEAIRRAPRRNISTDEMEEKLTKEFEMLGPLLFSFDSGTSPAIKQMRHKLLMSGAGSINLEIDEIGSNLVHNTDVLNSFLELYDVGKIKPKLIKNTAENLRSEEIDGKTPTNMMLYGTPSKLMNGGKTEEEFMSMLDTGYARRCLFGYSTKVLTDINVTPEDLYDMLTDSSSDSVLDDLAISMHKLADPINFNSEIALLKPESLILLEYKQLCENRSRDMRDFEEIQKAEMSHRYFKALKLAGAYAFIDSSSTVTSGHLYSAFKLVEDSGEAFGKMLNRPRSHERVAMYLADVRKEVTHVDLMEDLPFFRGGAAQRKDIMSQAIAWGYRNNIVIRTSYSDSIEFFKGETMDEVDMSNLLISYSTDIVNNYEPEYAPWDQLHHLVSADDYHYAAHHFQDKYRTSDKAIPGFNLVILDVDEGTSLKQAKMLLKDYKAFFATTKRHTEAHNRFRIIMPLTHTVKLNTAVYSKFMTNLFEWLPFETDRSTKDIARKWQSFAGEHSYQDGRLLDALMFIPDTNKQAEQHQKIMDHASLSNLERWLLLNAGVGSRSNTLIKYTYVLVDGGYTIEAIRNSVISFNQKLSSPLPQEELEKTVLTTAMSAVTKRNSE